MSDVIVAAGCPVVVDDCTATVIEAHGDTIVAPVQPVLVVEFGGPQGPPGLQGEQGLQGLQGEQGEPAAVATEAIEASEALAAGDLVNVYDNAGTPNCRKADASAVNAGKRAHGFVLSAVLSGATATVYFGDPDTAVAGLTSGPQFLSATVPGEATTVIPTGTGQFVQPVGVAVGATVLIFTPEPGYILA